VNRTSVLACIERHLLTARKEPGWLRPLGELIPPIAAELRAGVDTSNIQVVNTPVPLVAAFVDGAITPQEESAVCRAILVDNSVLAEVVASVLALDEVSANADPLPALSDDLTARLFEFASQSFSSIAGESVAANGQPVATQETMEEKLREHSVQAVNTVQSQAKANWWRPTIAILVAAACLLLIVWWVANQSVLRQKLEQVVRTPEQEEGRESLEPTTQEAPTPLTGSENETVANAAQESLNAAATNTSDVLTPERLSLGPLEVPKLVANTPEMPKLNPSELKTAGFKAIKILQWKKISGLLARRTLNPDYADDAGWKGVRSGVDVDKVGLTDSTQLVTLPMSRAEAEISDGGSMVMAADTELTFTPGDKASSAKVSLSHGLIAFVDMPQDTAIEFTDSDRTAATIKWIGSKSTLLIAVTDAGLQAQVTGGEVTINQQSVRNSIVSIDSQSVTELEDRNTRLPAWVSRPVESIPVSKAALGQLANADSLADAIDQLLDGNPPAGETDSSRIMLSNWRAALSDSNLLRSGESRSPLVRLQALQRLLALPEWDVRYRHSWQRFATTVNSEADLTFLRQAFELVRRGGKLNVAQIAQLVKLLDSPLLTVRSLSDFILRSNFGGGPQFDPHLQPSSRGSGLWKRYISAVRNNGR
jgi:hypothetical protein